MNEDFRLLIERVKNSRTTEKVTARTIVRAFGFEKRTAHQRSIIDAFFDEKELEVIPHYGNVWIDGYVEIRPKELASRKVVMDPIRRLYEMECANNERVSCVSAGQSLYTATTIMLQNNYSQLPVTNHGKRGLIGYISWETIGVAINSGVTSGIVKDYMSTDVFSLRLDTPILKALRLVYDNDFIVVLDSVQQVCGIVTTADLSSRYLEKTEPYVMLEEIENHIRLMLEGKVLKEQLIDACTKANNKQDAYSVNINTIDDLSFFQYQEVFSRYWNRLELKSIDKNEFLNLLNSIREIRNDVMHFDPDEISQQSKNTLKESLRYFRMITNKMV